MSAYEVEPYSLSRLGALLDELSHDGRGYSQAKSHLTYLDEYFRTIGAVSILIEDPYTDRDYLEDYAAYYARCHAEYKRRCARLHFFSDAFDKSLVEQAIDGDAQAVSRIKNSYLGFMVIKPLPSTVIGRTCLVTYGNTNRSRSFPTTRDYKVHLFGIELKVQSLPFQEQDRDVAACATSALWSVFNATGHLFQHHIPSPAEITKAASATHRLVNRTLPAGDGLTAEQMADAIRSVGLEPLYLSAKNIDYLLISACAYLRARIPCLLMGEICQQTASNFQSLGHHAIALTGFSEPLGPPNTYDSTLFTATSAIRLYAHDDQVGPFSRLTISRASQVPILTSWVDPTTGARGTIYFKPTIMLVPLYHKIRVPLTSVVPIIVGLNEWLELARRSGIIQLNDPVEWDVALVENADLKQSIHTDQSIMTSFRKKALLDDLPRYIWRVKASSSGARLFDLVLDATDLLQGGEITRGLAYSGPVCRSIGVLASNPTVKAHIRGAGHRGVEKALQWFSENTNDF